MIEKLPAERLAKLPKNLQRYIETLHMKYTEAENKVNELLNAQTESRVWTGSDFMGKDDRQFIKDGTVTFNLVPKDAPYTGNDKTISVRVTQIGDRAPVLVVHGYGGLVIKPTSSNGLEVRVDTER